MRSTPVAQHAKIRKGFSELLEKNLGTLREVHYEIETPKRYSKGIKKKIGCISDAASVG
jgi:hypothetical protein